MRTYGTWAQWKRRAKKEPQRVTFHINDNYTLADAMEWKARHRAGPPKFHSVAEAARRAAG